jgi:tryptophanase
MHSKIRDDCLNHETLMSLFDTYISCILSYGCETWGSHQGEDIEKLD